MLSRLNHVHVWSIWMNEHAGSLKSELVNKSSTKFTHPRCMISLAPEIRPSTRGSTNLRQICCLLSSHLTVLYHEVVMNDSSVHKDGSLFMQTWTAHFPSTSVPVTVRNAPQQQSNECSDTVTHTKSLYCKDIFKHIRHTRFAKDFACTCKLCRSNVSLPLKRKCAQRT